MSTNKQPKNPKLIKKKPTSSKNVHNVKDSQLEAPVNKKKYKKPKSKAMAESNKEVKEE